MEKKDIQRCPHCGQTMMVYRRGLRKSLILGLIQLWDKGPCKIADLKLSFGVSADLPKLRFWGLICRDGEDNRTNVTWKITERGKDFLMGRMIIPKYVFIYNNELQNFSSEMIGVENIHHERIDFETALENSEAFNDFKKRNQNEIRKMPEVRENEVADKTLQRRPPQTPVHKDVQEMPQ